MVHNFKSVKNIIDGIYRDYDSANDLEVWDVVEWCAEALELIGAGTQYVDRIIQAEVTNHNYPLPYDFHHLMQISFQGTPGTRHRFLSFRPSGGGGPPGYLCSPSVSAWTGNRMAQSGRFEDSTALP